MTFERLAFPAFAALALTSAALPAQTPASPAPGSAPGYSFADLADLASNAPTVIDAQIRSAIRLKPTDSPIPEGIARFYVEADARALIRGAPGSPVRFTYLADVPLDSRGKPPKLKKLRVLLLARPVPGKPGSIQLIAPHAQIPWSQPADTELRRILGELTAANAAPRITGIRNAFHVPGTVKGEGETQIFLQTEIGNPVSISVLRRPGEIARWSVALGEIVDEAGGAPRPGSLLWFRLACALPRALPDRAIDPGEPANAAQARADYQVVLDGLGPCTRQKPAILTKAR